MGRIFVNSFNAQKLFNGLRALFTWESSKHIIEIEKQGFPSDKKHKK